GLCLQLHSVDQNSVTSSSSLEAIMDRAYERYDVGLRRVQLLYSKSGDAWKSARLQSSSVQHILQPMDLTLHLAKCMVEKDARMPRFKVSGELPLMHVRISDQKIQKVLELVESVPVPKKDSAPCSPTEKALPLSRVLPPAQTLDPTLLDTFETDSEEEAGDRLTNEEQQRLTQEELINVHFKFELKEVLLELTQQADQEKAVLSFNISQLGAEGRMRSFDLSVASYLRRLAVDYCDVPVGREPLHLISSLQQQDSNLLKVEFIKADPNGPSFQTQFSNTEQTLKVELSSLDFLLHTKALLATISYLNSAVPQQFSATRDPDTKKLVQKTEQSQTVSKSKKDGGVFTFKLFATLGCFHVEVCDDRCSIADIRVQEIKASVFMQAKETEVFARLGDIVVTDANPKTVHRKAVSIVGNEVFSFKLSLFPGATQGEGYGDMSKVDGKVTMSLGCIQIVYLHKFFMSLLASFSFQYPSADEMFVDNFQTAKEALSAATSQAAERAASSVRDFAQKSFRLSMDIKLKAPIIIIPQSSTSQNALVVDLGLITVGNSFALRPIETLPLPAVVEKMEVKLTQLKLSRKTPKIDFPPKDIEILQPINVDLLVTRNLAASQFSDIPGVQVQGVLRSLNMSLGEEELGVLMKILVENIGEGSKDQNLEVKTQAPAEKAELSERPKETLVHPESNGMKASTHQELSEKDVVKVLLGFEVKQVLLSLKKRIKLEEAPFLVFQLDQLGIDAKVRKYDLSATTYIRQVSMKSLEFKDSVGDPLCLISSSAEAGAELLKVEFRKADRCGPEFCSIYQNTEQMIHVTFSSLDVTLHTQALLSAVNFLSSSLSSGSAAPAEKDIQLKTEEKTPSVKPSALVSPVDSEVIDLKATMTLGAFNILVCDQTCSMADIKVKGLNSSFLMQGAQTHISARLEDVIVLDVDPKGIHKEAISIVGDEVFSFSMSLTPNATEGPGYTDTSRTDGRVKLSVGCIRVVYLHKFFMSLLNFSNNFQTAKEALSSATAQAAEKAASSVRDLAQKSFRLSMAVRVKAPLIIIPQSSTSKNAIVVDLGLITVENSFSLVTVAGCSLPAVVDSMDVQLSELKLSRTWSDSESEKPNIELLKPVNLLLNIRRNLSAGWYRKMAAVEVNGDLKPMKLELSQDDLRVMLRIVTENLGEANTLDPSAPQQEVSLRVQAPKGAPTGEAERPAGRLGEDGDDEAVEMLRFHFNIESLELVLFHNNPKQQPADLQHHQDLRLGELALRLMKASGKILNNGSMEVNTVLTACTLDDLRSGVDRVTSRMVGQKEDGQQAMIDVTFRQAPAERDLVAILQKLYLCASTEFLMAVADFFLQAVPQSPASAPPAAASDKLPLKQTAEPRAERRPASAVRTRLRAVIVDPEVVFVANLMKADAPALVASFQGDFNLVAEEDGTQNMRANLRDLKVLACPFIQNKEDKSVTTVLKPCSVSMETKTSPNQPLSGFVTVEEVIIKISPVILNTVMTITAGIAAKTQAEQSQEQKADVSNLWSIMDIYNCNFWFLGVDQATEITENYAESDGSKDGETFKAQVKSVQMTLESGLGHRTVPLLLAESSLNGVAKNWSSLLHLTADMTLEAFAEGTALTFDHTLKEKPPFTIKNSLGIPVIVQHSASLRPVGSVAQGKLHELSVDQSMDLVHSGFESTMGGKLSALERQESCLFNLTVVPSGYSEICSIPVDKPGRRLYNVRGPMLQEAVSVLLQIDAAEGNKIITVRSPLQIMNHFSEPFSILKYCAASRDLQSIGTAEPEKEFHVDLDAYRCQLFVRPAGRLDGLYAASSSCMAWKEQVHCSAEVQSVLQCPASDSNLLPLMVSTLAVPDDLRHISSHGEEDWDPAYVIHLHPVAALCNLLPYTVSYIMENSANVYELQEGTTSDLLNARLSGEIMSLALLQYQGRGWHGHIQITRELPEFFAVSLTCDTDASLSVDVSIHVTKTKSRLLLSLFSPYWIINKTSRVLQYRSEDVMYKHPAEYRDVVLFSFKKSNLFTKSKTEDSAPVGGASVHGFLSIGSDEVHELKPCEARRFVWDDPGGTRKLCWSCKGRSEELDLLKDDVGQFPFDGQSHVHWVSFLDGRQRVLLFTEDTGVVTKARQSEELEQFQQELKVSLQNLGLSLVDNSSRQEISYIGITSSGVVWEYKPKNRWKSFNQKNINLLEKTYQSQLSEKKELGWVTLENNLEVNLNQAVMKMRQPQSCPVRRNFLSGIQVEFKQSLHQRSLRAQLHWLQVDNQLPGAVFPIVFHPVPPPKSIALDSEPKPFMDMSVIMRFNQHSSVMQFKYFMALVQEMAVKIDQGFLDAVAALFAPAANLQNDGQKSGLIEGDLKRLQAEPTDASLADGSGISFFEFFHISPIKLHLSLSLGSSDGDSAQQNPITQSLNLVLKSIGATLTNVDDIIFKLAFFEVKYQFYSKEKLMWAVGRHYTEEFLKQMYVLVLGLDVLGNPFGLIRGLSEGVEAFFYEPFQGAVQGPEEFAEGFAIGVRSLLGSTVGGAAGMFSKITGSMGKGLAVITMDKEFQQERREEMNRPTRDFKGSLAKGGKGLLKGVVGGVTGIVTKPVEGAKKEGAAGFFKGIGKGLVGVVARPTGGIVDMASSTFQGIQRAAEATEEVTKLRPVRLIKEDGVIRPYDATESQGFDLYQRTGIKPLEGEAFRTHCPNPAHRKSNIIVTNRRVFCVKEMDLLGHLITDWECLFENFHRPPAVSGSELKIYCKVTNTHCFQDVSHLYL
ncbi:PREDICTED: vacuolar protein sorting-associated protein 13C, partial [Cyprinodon variegatus]|uniref:vacuolar protein sorting-associated protein 13C n=1 Tax=Cyprinodon variegatus TaxID=28743 RepID=UPI00074252C5